MNGEHRIGDGSTPFLGVTSVRPAQARQILGGIGNTTLWRWVKELEGFPQPIKIGPRVTVFDLPALLAFRDAQAAK